MQVIATRNELREQLADWRHDGDHIALVPTMGNLHDGHLGLVKLARQHAERVVVSVFVNPLQFGEGEDFEEYPRTLRLDTQRLKPLKADLLFAPDTETVYPFGIENAATVHVPGLGDDLCGASRPGHFDGVATVVARLLCMVHPDTAVFGQKDYQQLLIIRRLVQDLGLPIDVVAGPTSRDDDGLARSSRNQYLTDAERAIAPTLYAVLTQVAQALASGRQDYGELESAAAGRLADAGFGVDYVSIRRAENLGDPDRETDELVVLAAAQLGKARLIDNVLVHI